MLNRDDAHPQWLVGLYDDGERERIVDEVIENRQLYTLSATWETFDLIRSITSNSNAPSDLLRSIFESDIGILTTWTQKGHGPITDELALRGVAANHNTPPDVLERLAAFEYELSRMSGHTQFLSHKQREPFANAAG